MISLSLRKFHALNTKSFLGFSSIQSVKGMKDMVDEYKSELLLFTSNVSPSEICKSLILSEENQSRFSKNMDTKKFWETSLNMKNFSKDLSVKPVKLSKK